MLMLGTFPPAEKRWAMKFYYPNFTNDMWRIFGLCFFGDKLHFVWQEQKTYDLDGIIAFLKERGIALFDTATRVVRTKNTASDKDLQVVEETDLRQMLRQFAISEPRVGDFSEFQLDGRTLRLYRMPSSSRAYPMPVEQKAIAYQTVFDEVFKW